MQFVIEDTGIGFNQRQKTNFHRYLNNMDKFRILKKRKECGKLWVGVTVAALLAKKLSKASSTAKSLLLSDTKAGICSKLTFDVDISEKSSKIQIFSNV